MSISAHILTARRLGLESAQWDGAVGSYAVRVDGARPVHTSLSLTLRHPRHYRFKHAADNKGMCTIHSTHN